MSWNNGNGNGQGISEDTYSRMNNARDPGGARFPFIEAGRHKFAVATIEKFSHRTDGACARILLKVLESNAHKQGSFVVKIYKLTKPGKFESSLSDAEQMADFCMKLKNAPKGHPIGQDIRTLLELRPAEQLARGSVIECTGVAAKGTWTNLYWAAVPQTPQDIVAMRQRMEAEGIPETGPSAQQGGQQAPQMQGPPQMQQVSYPAPGMQGYAQPQFAPVPGYGAPQQPQFVPSYTQPAPTGTAPGFANPNGGFLAQIPPQGGNGPGGNNGGQGGSW